MFSNSRNAAVYCCSFAIARIRRMRNDPERRIPNRLRRYRRIMGYDQRDVAFLLGLSSHTRISEWEDGKYAPTLYNLLQLSIIYRTLPDELYYDLRQELIDEIRKRESRWQLMRSESG